MAEAYTKENARGDRVLVTIDGDYYAVTVLPAELKSAGVDGGGWTYTSESPNPPEGFPLHADPELILAWGLSQLPDAVARVHRAQPKKWVGPTLAARTGDEVAMLERLPDDARDGATNFEIGTKLLGESDRVRVWEIKLASGERLPFHCHRTSYFWVVHTGTPIRATFPDGTYHDHERRGGHVRRDARGGAARSRPRQYRRDRATGDDRRAVAERPAVLATA